jgi:hypothetical protein
MLGWQGYFNFTQVRYILKELDSWVKRRLRCYLWKQWGRRGYRELRKLGVSRDLAWNTAKSAHGPWRLKSILQHWDCLGCLLKRLNQPNRRGT